MPSGGFELDVDGLRGIGKKVATSAETLGAAVRTAGTGLAPALRPGSSATAAAQAAEQVWTAGLQQLTSQIDGYSASLITAAEEYAAADEANAKKLRYAGTGANR